MSEKQKRRLSDQSSTSTDSANLYIPTPPDGGWGWIIVISSFFNNVIVDGIAYSFGVFYLEFVDYFQESKGKTALVGSLLCGTYLCCGPLVSALTNRFGCRPVTIAGSLIATVAFLLSTLSPSVDILILTYGVLGGIGFGMIYLPSIVSVGYYFEGKRAMATGIAVCGSGVGTFIFAPLATVLLEHYDWKNAMFILAGIILHSCVFGALMRPLEISKRKRKMKHRVSECSAQFNAIENESSIIQGVQEAKLAREKRLREESESEYASINNSAYPSPNKTSDKVSFCSAADQVPTDIRKGETINYLRECGSDGKLNEDVISVNHSQASQSSTGNNFLAIPDNNLKSKVGSSISVIWEKAKRCSQSSTLEKISKEDYARPLYRQDIFYSGSIMHVPQFRSQPDIRSYVASITTIPQTTSPGMWSCFCCSKNFTDVLRNMLDVKVLKQKNFLLICLGNIFGMIGFYVPFVYITDWAVLLDIPEGQASLLVSVMGITNTIGRVVSGIVADHPRVDALLVNNICLLISGVATAVSPFCQDYATLIVYCSVFGLCISAYISLTSVILCDMLGLEQLTTAFGILTLARGLSATVGPPIAGAVFDATKSYNVSFYLAGGFILAASASHFILYLPYFKNQTPQQGNVNDDSNKDIRLD